MNASQLHLSFPFDFFLGKGGILQNLPEAVQGHLGIALHAFQVDSKAVVTCVSVDASSDRFDLFHQFGCSLLAGSLEQTLAHPLSDPIEGGRFGENTPKENRTQFNERQSVVPLEKDAHAFGALPSFNRMLIRASLDVGCFGCSVRWQKGIDSLCFCSQVLLGNSHQILWFELLHLLEKVTRKAEVPCRHPGTSQILCLPLHGFLR